MTIEEYIQSTWDSLTRDLAQAAAAANDPKLESQATIYLAPTHQTKIDGLEGSQIRRLTPGQLIDPSSIDPHGLLYLPEPYVVPGGRFNEMYGWDSYFINLGLLKAGRPQLAQQMVDNHLYQVQHYGKILNANRTYYLTRSQPPFLACMVADVFEQIKDKVWLANTWDSLLRTYELWVTEPHLTPASQLSRYFDSGTGPAPEVVASELDEEGLTHYERLIREFRVYQTLSLEQQLEQLGYQLSTHFDAELGTLTEACYKGDRSMRESGYDPSDRFGRFNVDIVNYNPVDLNSLLYRYELEMEKLASILGHEVNVWKHRSEARREHLQMFWDEETGLFLDWNISTQQRRNYPFATTFFPLWAGWATPEQAHGVHSNLSTFLHPGGLVTSTNQSGQQWDYPFGWAPLQWIAAKGLTDFGYHDSAKTIAERFNGLVKSEYQRTRTIVEKYNVVDASSEVSADIEFGYSSNEVGFGWTNAVYLLLEEMISSNP